MSKIVFFCIPAHGHTNPTLPVVRELVDRGHQVKYYSYEMFREKIESAGAEFVACDKYDSEQKLEPEDALRVGKDIGFSTGLLVDTTLALDKYVCRDMEEWQPDCIVADSMAVWGKAVAKKLQIPFMSSTTTFAFNKYSAKIMKQSFSQMWNLIVSMPSINKDIARLQESGYPVKNILDIIQNDDTTNTIVYTSKEFQPCADTFPKIYHFVGPSISAAALQKAEITDEDVRMTKKTIYISLGTVVNRMIPFYKNCIKAFKDTDYRVIMSVGKLTELKELGEIPANFRVEQFVNQLEVLSQADVFLSHCGMNSVNESLYFEVPLVLFPQTAEQGGVARRVSELGAGVYLKRNCPKEIKAAVEKVLADASYKESAAKISKSFQNSGGPKEAADAILALCKSV